jgi:hypothetical protein
VVGQRRPQRLSVHPYRRQPFAWDRRLERRSVARCRDGRVDRPASDRGGDTGSGGRTRGWALPSPWISPGGLINAGHACTGHTQGGGVCRT